VRSGGGGMDPWSHRLGKAGGSASPAGRFTSPQNCPGAATVPDL